ncbi:MAG: ATP-binding protein [Nitrososphaerota archaeon]|nr:ATP-binding protein [Nitrososphaerota archaeon]
MFGSLSKTPYTDEAKRQLLASYAFSGEQERRKLRSIIHSISDPYVVLSAIPLPVSTATPGDIVLGRRILGQSELSDYVLSREELTKNVAILGPTGSGKTNLVNQLLTELNKREIPFLAFDVKQDARYLVNRISNLVVLKATQLRSNLLEPPPGVSHFDWLMEVASFTPGIWGFYQIGTGSYYLEVLVEVAESIKGSFTLYDVQRRLQEENVKTARKSEWFDVLSSRVNSTLATIGPSIATKGFSIHELLDKPVVLELFGLRETEAKLIVAWFLSYILLYRRAQNHRGRLYHVNVIDEAHRLLSVPYEWATSIGDSIVERFVRESRDFGEANVYCFQEISRVHHSVLANTDTKFCAALSSGDDIEAAAESMNLDRTDTARMMRLPVGYWMAKKRSSEPEIVKVPLVPVPKNLTESELEEKMGPWIERMRSFESRKVETIVPELANDELLFLKAVCENPFSSKSELYDSMPGQRGAKVELGRALVGKNVLRVEKVQLFSQKHMEFYLPTSTGIKLMYKNNFNGANRWYAVLKSGTFAHSLIIFHAWRILKQYGNIEREKKIPDTRKQPDLLCEIDGREAAIEIYSSPAVDAENVHSALPHLDLMLMVCLDVGILNSVKKTIENFGISENPKLRYYPNPFSFFADIRSRSTLYHLLSIKQTEHILNQGTQATNESISDNGTQNGEKS